MLYKIKLTKIFLPEHFYHVTRKTETKPRLERRCQQVTVTPIKNSHYASSQPIKKQGWKYYISVFVDLVELLMLIRRQSNALKACMW